VLVLAWALSAASEDLHLGLVATRLLQDAHFAPQWLPLLIFLAAAGVSFATGTSWGTMSILCPVVVAVAAGLIGDLPPDTGRTLFYASVGSVLAGAVFGDHCSPISDTTVLSAAASSCSLEEHVWTQFPYAAVSALVAIAAGNVLCNLLGVSVWISLGFGVVLLAVVVRAAGRVNPPAPGSATR
jgi:Na+/H+ antiporter NhaC